MLLGCVEWGLIECGEEVDGVNRVACECELRIGVSRLYFSG